MTFLLSFFPEIFQKFFENFITSSTFLLKRGFARISPVFEKRSRTNFYMLFL